MIIAVAAAIAVPIAYYQIKAQTERQFGFLADFNIAYGQLSQKYSNCIFMYQQGMYVNLAVSSTCDKTQFLEAVNYYKTHGFPYEYQYINTLAWTSMMLTSEP